MSEKHYQKIDFIRFNSAYNEPQFEVKKGRHWLEFGEDNLLPDYVDSLIDLSADHSAILNGTALFAQGGGLKMPTDPRATMLFQNGQRNAISPNDLNHVQEKLIRDLVVHGAALLNVRWRRDRTGIADVHHVPVRKMRLDNDEGYWLSNDWKNYRRESNVPRHYQPFNQSLGAEGSQLVYIKLPSARQAPYGMAPYWSCRQSIELQKELAVFNLNRVRNNFFASVIISYEDIPSTEIQDANHKALKEYFCGPKGKNVGGALILYGKGVKIEKFEAAVSPSDFQQMQDTADQLIRSAHRVAGRGDLFGLNRGDGVTFSSNDDLINEFEVFSKLVVTPIQNTVCSVWNMLSQINGVNHTWEVEPFTLFSDALPVAMEGGSTPDVQQTALNGAQVDSLVAIIGQVNQGVIPAANAKPLIQAAFPAIPETQIDAMLAGLQKTPPPILPSNGI